MQMRTSLRSADARAGCTKRQAIKEGAMHKEQYLHIRKYLTLGILVTVMSVLFGEIPLGYAVYPEIENPLIRLLVGSQKISMLQLACGVLFGGIGIPLQYYGYKAIADLIDLGNAKRCAKIVDIGAKANAFWGGIVHVTCIAGMFVCKCETGWNAEQLPAQVAAFAVWILLPITIVFMACYFSMTIAMMIPILKEETVLPKWAFVLNPLFVKILLNSLAFVMPNTPLMNGIRMANMGIGAFITFVGIGLLLKKQNSKVESH
jgi:hypothetical protein